MEQATNDPPGRRSHGGDTRTPKAKFDVAQREQQIVALRLRGVSFYDIGRVIGISRVSAFKAFKRALHRQTSQDIQGHHRAELAKLDMEETNLWRLMDANKADWRVHMSGTAQLRGIHVRRARLLGLDAPNRLDVSGIYGASENEASAERLENERVWLAMSPEVRARHYDEFDEARKRLNAPIETTATVPLGSDNRDDIEPSDDDE